MLLKDEDLSREEKQTLKEDYQTQIDNVNYDRQGYKKSLKQKRREKMQIMLQQTKTKEDIQLDLISPTPSFVERSFNLIRRPTAEIQGIGKTIAS